MANSFAALNWFSAIVSLLITLGATTIYGFIFTRWSKISNERRNTYFHSITVGGILVLSLIFMTVNAFIFLETQSSDNSLNMIVVDLAETFYLLAQSILIYLYLSQINIIFKSNIDVTKHSKTLLFITKIMIASFIIANIILFFTDYIIEATIIRILGFGILAIWLLCYIILTIYLLYLCNKQIKLARNSDLDSDLDGTGISMMIKFKVLVCVSQVSFCFNEILYLLISFTIENGVREEIGDIFLGIDVIITLIVIYLFINTNDDGSNINGLYYKLCGKFDTCCKTSKVVYVEMNQMLPAKSLSIGDHVQTP